MLSFMLTTTSLKTMGTDMALIPMLIAAGTLDSAKHIANVMYPNGEFTERRGMICLENAHYRVYCMSDMERYSFTEFWFQSAMYHINGDIAHLNDTLLNDMNERAYKVVVL